MKCSVCGKDAVRYIPYANIALCKEHYVEWFERRFFRHVENFKIFEGSKKVAVAVSGGKDSVSLLHLVKMASEKYGFEVLGITIDLGIDKGTAYSKKSVDVAISNYKKLGVDYIIVPLKERHGFSIDDAKRFVNRPVCSTCGLAKRYVLNEIAEEQNADTLATGHNLDDMAQYVLSAYIHGNLEYVLRNGPVVPARPGYPVKKVKPLFLIPEEETLHYALIKGFEFIYDPCPYSREFSRVSKEKLGLIIKKIEKEYPGFTLGLVQTFEKEVKPMLSYKEESQEISRCKICGRPTTPGREICSFCSVKMKIYESLHRSDGLQKAHNS